MSEIDYLADNWPWRKSSYSVADGQCVEVACVERAIVVRDSRDPGRAISLTNGQWEKFLITIKHSASASCF